MTYKLYDLNTINSAEQRSDLSPGVRSIYYDDLAQYYAVCNVKVPEHLAQYPASKKRQGYALNELVKKFVFDPNTVLGRELTILENFLPPLYMKRVYATILNQDSFSASAHAANEQINELLKLVFNPGSLERVNRRNLESIVRAEIKHDILNMNSALLNGDYCRYRSLLKKQVNLLSQNLGHVPNEGALRQIAGTTGPIKPHEQKQITKFLKRIECRRFWRRFLRRYWDNLDLEVARRLGIAGYSGNTYLPHNIIRRKQWQAKSRINWLKSKSIRIGSQTTTLDKHLQKERINELAELNLRLGAQHQRCLEKKLTPYFVTITCPTRFHATRTLDGGRVVKNPEFDSALMVQDACAWLGLGWKRFRANMQKLVGKDGWEFFRVLHPHLDATPHWHLILYIPQSKSREIREYLYKAFEVWDQEQDCQRRRVAYEKVNKFDAVRRYLLRGLKPWDQSHEATNATNLGGKSRYGQAFYAAALARRAYSISNDSVSIWRWFRSARPSDVVRWPDEMRKLWLIVTNQRPDFFEYATNQAFKGVSRSRRSLLLFIPRHREKLNQFFECRKTYHDNYVKFLEKLPVLNPMYSPKCNDSDKSYTFQTYLDEFYPGHTYQLEGKRITDYDDELLALHDRFTEWWWEGFEDGSTSHDFQNKSQDEGAKLQLVGYYFIDAIGQLVSFTKSSSPVIENLDQDSATNNETNETLLAKLHLLLNSQEDTQLNKTYCDRPALPRFCKESWEVGSSIKRAKGGSLGGLPVATHVELGRSPPQSGFNTL